MEKKELGEVSEGETEAERQEMEIEIEKKGIAKGCITYSVTVRFRSEDYTSPEMNFGMGNVAFSPGLADKPLQQIQKVANILSSAMQNGIDDGATLNEIASAMASGKDLKDGINGKGKVKNLRTGKWKDIDEEE